MSTVKNRLSKTIFGALNMRTSRFYWKQADRGNSQQFILFLHHHHLILDQFIDISTSHFEVMSNDVFSNETALPEDDAVKKAPNHHEVLCDNPYVRVLFGYLLAGEQEPLHRHYWPSILVMLTSSTFDIEYADKTKEREHCPMGVYKLPADTQAAAYTNLDSEGSFLRFELKP